ncbi:MAG: LysR family transcriptional regulator [Ilumatobacteraceae bacterium]
MMDLVHVRSFVEVALRGTVVAAAAARGYSPPAVSQHLAKLETELASSLFERSEGKLRLTAAGDAFLPLALDLLDLERRAREAAGRPMERPRLTIAGFASAIATLVLPKVKDLDASFVLEIVEAEDAEALRDLALGAVDVVLTQHYEGVVADCDHRFRYTPLVTDPLRLVIPRNRPLSTRLKDLGGARWLFNGRGTRCTDAALRLLAAAGLHPPTAGSIGDNSTLLALVAAGQGVAIVPELVITESQRRVRVADQDLGSFRTIFAVTRSSAAAPVIELIARLAGPDGPAPPSRQPSRSAIR